MLRRGVTLLRCSERKRYYVLASGRDGARTVIFRTPQQSLVVKKTLIIIND